MTRGAAAVVIDQRNPLGLPETLVADPGDAGLGIFHQVARTAASVSDPEQFGPDQGPVATSVEAHLPVAQLTAVASERTVDTATDTTKSAVGPIDAAIGRHTLALCELLDELAEQGESSCLAPTLAGMTTLRPYLEQLVAATGLPAGPVRQPNSVRQDFDELDDRQYRQQLHPTETRLVPLDDKGAIARLFEQYDPQEPAETLEQQQNQRAHRVNWEPWVDTLLRELYLLYHTGVDILSDEPIPRDMARAYLAAKDEDDPGDKKLGQLSSVSPADFASVILLKQCRLRGLSTDETIGFHDAKDLKLYLLQLAAYCDEQIERQTGRRLSRIGRRTQRLRDRDADATNKALALIAKAVQKHHDEVRQKEIEKAEASMSPAQLRATRERLASARTQASAAIRNARRQQRQGRQSWQRAKASEAIARLSTNHQAGRSTTGSRVSPPVDKLYRVA